jgi:hypothetical protein
VSSGKMRVSRSQQHEAAVRRSSAVSSGKVRISRPKQRWTTVRRTSSTGGKAIRLTSPPGPIAKAAKSPAFRTSLIEEAGSSRVADTCGVCSSVYPKTALSNVFMILE